MFTPYTHLHHTALSATTPMIFWIIYSYVTWLIHIWRYSVYIRVTWQNKTYDMTKRDMTHSYMAWLIHMWHDSFICGLTHSYVTRLWIYSRTTHTPAPRENIYHIWTSHVTNKWVKSRMNESGHIWTIIYSLTPHAPASRSGIWDDGYGVATISRLLKIRGLFCRI